MKSRFDFQDVHRKTGVLVILTGVVLLVGLLFAARVQHWFEPVFYLSVDLGEEGAPGLEVGSDVKMLGTTIGRVESVTLDETENLTLVAIARMGLRGSMVRFVRQDSKVLKRGVPLLGGAYLEITRGTGNQLFGEGVREASLPTGVSPQEDMLKKATQIAEDLLAEVQQLLRRAEEEGALGLALGFEERARLLEEFRARGALGLALGTEGWEPVRELLRQLEEEGVVRVVTGDAEAPRTLVATLDGVAAMVRTMEAEGPLGWLLGRSEAGASLNGILATLRGQLEVLERRGPFEVLLSDPELDPERATRIAADLERILANLTAASDEIPVLARAVGEEATTLPTLVAELESTLQQVEILVRAFQDHWLIRGYVDPRPADGRIPVEQLDLEGGAR